MRVLVVGADGEWSIHDRASREFQERIIRIARMQRRAEENNMKAAMILAAMTAAAATPINVTPATTTAGPDPHAPVERGGPDVQYFGGSMGKRRMPSQGYARPRDGHSKWRRGHAPSKRAAKARGWKR